jgi:hypothetical protein
MAKDPPDFEPRSFVAGATVCWSKSLADYPASDGWTLKYSFRGPDAAGLDVTATADGDDYLVNISATASAVAAGTYWWQAYVTKGSEKYFVGEGQTVVKATLTGTAVAYDGRSDAELVLAALVALSKTKATLIQGEYTIAGRQMKFETQADLIQAINFWAGMVRNERRQKRMSEGGDFFQQVNVRFDPASR